MKICIGIDQSYTNCGWSICLDGNILEYGNIAFKGLNSNSEKRKEVHKVLTQLIEKSLSEVNSEPNKVIVVFERIRLYSQGFLSMDYIVKTAGLISTIIDTAYEYNIKCYSVDTRSWKKQIVGNSKGQKKKVLITKGKNKGKYRTVTDNKTETLNHVKNNFGIDTKGDDDIADAICISKYAFIDKKDRKLKLEK